MFKSEAKLFLSANNNVNSAKTLINECKRLIVDFDLEGNSDCKNLKRNINNCDIDGLVIKVNKTLESLKNLQPDFASEYYYFANMLSKIGSLDMENKSEEQIIQEYTTKYDMPEEQIREALDLYYSYTKHMSDEQKKMFVDCCNKEYNYSLLYMLEKYEESGMLTDEMKLQLQYQRELVTQYDIQDKMAVLDPTTDEYIDLFKKNADIDRNLINLNPGLTAEQKADYLKEYNTQYNQNLDALINARDARLKREADEKELEELYAAKEANDNFWHPFVESELNEAILDKKIEMGIATQGEIDYKNADWFGRACMDTGTFAVSTFTGAFDVLETIGDGGVMLVGGIGGLFGADTQWAEDYVSIDLSGELYQGIVLSTGMNTYSAYSDWHTAGENFGNLVGKVGMSFAAPWANALLSGFAAMGQSAETSFNNGDDYWAAFGKSLVSGVGGAAEGYAFSKMNLEFRKFVNSGALKTLGKSALSGIKNFGATLTSPGGLKIVGGNLWNLAKTGVKHMPSALGKAGLATLKDADALIETGCVLANNFIEGATTGEMDWGKMLKETGAVFAINYFMSFATTLAFDINKTNTSLDAVSTTVVEDIDTSVGREFSPSEIYTNKINRYANETLEETITRVKNNSINHGLITDESFLSDCFDEYIDIINPKIQEEIKKQMAEEIFEELKALDDSISWDDALREFDNRIFNDEVFKKLYNQNVERQLQKQLTLTDMKMEVSLDGSATNGVVSYSNADEFYFDLATGSYAYQSKAYDNARMLAFEKGASSSDFVRVSETYLNGSDKFLATQSGEPVSKLISGDNFKNAPVGTKFELDGAPVMGIPGENQYIASASQVDDIMKKIEGVNNDPMSMVEKRAEVLGLGTPIQSSYIEVVHDLPKNTTNSNGEVVSNLVNPNSTMARANSQMSTAGLPYTMIGDEKISAFEFTTPSYTAHNLDINSSNFYIKLHDGINVNGGRVIIEDGKYYLIKENF